MRSAIWMMMTLMTLLSSGCASNLATAECVWYKPVHLRPASISALERSEKEVIAYNNLMWADVCK